MPKRNVIKLLLDIVMAGTLALLYNSHVFALGFHELAGLILAGLFVVHCLFNKGWIASVSARLLSKGLPIRVRIGYLIDALLAVTFGLIILSGILTSQVLFPAAVQNKNSAWRGIHHCAAAVSLILTGVHIGLHWRFIAGMGKKWFRMPAKLSRVLCLALLAALLSSGIYHIASGSFLPWLAEPFSRSAQLQREGRPGDVGDRQPKSNENKEERRGESKSEGSSAMGALSTAATYLSIMSVFAAVAHYLNTVKILRRY